jgi:cation:H+ antiporter
MGIALQLAVLAAGLALSVKGADFLVAGASSLGTRLKVSQMVIGMTVVAFGTSLPDFIINIIASMEAKSDLATGNVVGSNTFNILFILGLSALIAPVWAKKDTIWKEIPFVLLLSFVLTVLMADRLFGAGESVLTRGDGLILLVFFALFMYYIFSISKVDFPFEERKTYSSLATALLLLGGLASLVVGGELVVRSAEGIARFFGVGEKVIALTIVSIGTSFPELMTSVVASARRNNELALGNIVGSNIFNIVLIMGVSALIHPVRIDEGAYLVDFGAMVASALVLFASMTVYKKGRISRTEGALMTVAYVGYVAYLLSSA